MFSFIFWYTFVLLILMTLTLIFELLDIDIVVLVVLLLLVLGGVLPLQDAFAGFSNQGVLSIGALFVVSGALKENGLPDVVKRIIFKFRQPGVFKTLLTFSFISALFTPKPIPKGVVKEKAQMKSLVSYAVIFGSLCTLFGSHATLLVYGLMSENYQRELPFLEISKVGVPLAMIGGMVLLLFSMKRKKQQILLESEPEAKGTHLKLLVTIGIAALMLILCALDIFPIILVTGGVALVLVVSGCISPAQARQSIDWKVLILIGASFGISKGISLSHLGEFFADQLRISVGSMGELGLLLGIYFLTHLLTQLVTPYLGVMIVFPVAMALTQNTGHDPLPFALAIAISATACFSNFWDKSVSQDVKEEKQFIKIGVSLNILVGVVALFLLFLIYY